MVTFHDEKQPFHAGGNLFQISQAIILINLDGK